MLKPTGSPGKKLIFELIGNEHEVRIRYYNTPLTKDLLRRQSLKTY